MNYEINKLSDPTVVGPGTWWYTHKKAKETTTDKKIDEFIDHMDFLEKNFSCHNCRKHIQQYIDTHSFEDLRHLTNKEGTRIGMFKWAWMFHNAVNTRIGKPHVDWETAWAMYDDDDDDNESTVCSKNCDEVDSYEEVGSDNSDYDSEESYDSSENNRKKKSYDDNIPSIYSNSMDRKSKLVQSYFMSIGIPNTLNNHSVHKEKYKGNYEPSVTFI